MSLKKQESIKNKTINMEENFMTINIDNDIKPPKRSPWRAMGRGLKARCPECGEGKLFHKYLKASPACSSCGTPLNEHQADDAPSYFAMLFLSIIIAPIMVTIQLVYEWPMWLNFAFWTPLSLILVILILQPIKGAIIALQWAHYMHGFKYRREDD